MPQFQNLSIQAKVLSAIATVSLIAVVGFFVFGRELSRVKDAFEKLLNQDAVAAMSLANASAYSQQSASGIADLLMSLTAEGNAAANAKKDTALKNFAGAMTKAQGKLPALATEIDAISKKFATTLNVNCRETLSLGSASTSVEGNARAQAEFVANCQPPLLAVSREINAIAQKALITAEEQGEVIVQDSNAARLWVFGVAGLALALAIFAATLITRAFITRPLAVITQALEDMAGGNLDKQMTGQDRNDEIGAIVRSYGVLQQNLRQAKSLEEAQRVEQRQKTARAESLAAQVKSFESSVQAMVNMVASSATEMKASSDTLGRTAADTSTRATAVAAAATQASSSVQTVASAAEELTASIKEISQQVQTSARTAQHAVAKADETNQKVAKLAEASQRIGEVVKLINDIASQTNLLALNATIEAARAGDVGKGFAVVASEVKNLANQTAKATEDVSAQIAAIQAATGETVSAIKEIGSTISELDQVATAIAAAVEEQGSATQEISRSVQQAARGTSAVSANIDAVSMAAGETGSAATELQGSGVELSQQAEKLRLAVETFVANVRAA
jgi:methyl-accepting chemotaxis protein